MKGGLTLPQLSGCPACENANVSGLWGWVTSQPPLGRPRTPDCLCTALSLISLSHGTSWEGDVSEGGVPNLSACPHCVILHQCQPAGGAVTGGFFAICVLCVGLCFRLCSELGKTLRVLAVPVMYSYIRQSDWISFTLFWLLHEMRKASVMIGIGGLSGLCLCVKVL